MAGAGEGSFDLQEEFMLQEVAYSGGEAAWNSTGGGDVVGEYQPGKVGNLHERFASALVLAVEIVEERGCGCVAEEVGICPGFDAFLGIGIREFAFGHDALEDAIGAIAAIPIHVLFQVGRKRASTPPHKIGQDQLRIGDPPAQPGLLPKPANTTGNIVRLILLFQGDQGFQRPNGQGCADVQRGNSFKKF